MRIPNSFQKNLILWFCAYFLASCSFFQKQESEWEIYCKNFIQSDGRVVDNANHNISHSEGQGYAMLLAVHYDDQKTFELVRAWTFKNLAVRPDFTFAWQWKPSSKNQGAVSDVNNATDGDMLIAWALMRAAKKWNHSDYLESAKKIIVNLREKYTRQTSWGLVLLPGCEGFEHDQGIIVNPSYWIFPAIQDFDSLDPSPVWGQLAQSGRKIIQDVRFSLWHLPADWLLLSDPPVCAPQFSPMFGYNAIRIPLYLLWENNGEKEILQPIYYFWSNLQKLPVTLNLKTGQREYSPSSQGLQAIALWTIAACENQKPALEKLPVLHKKEDYFSASLLLLTKMALSESL